MASWVARGAVTAWPVRRACAGSDPSLTAHKRGCRQAPRASARALRAAHGLACRAGSGGWPVPSGEPAPRTVIATVPATIAVNVAIEGPGREIPDVTGVGVEPAGHTLPPYPAPAVTANRTSADGHGAADRPRRRPTRTADGARGTTATSHEPARGSRIATLPSYIDGNVAQHVRAGVSCDVAVVAGTTGHTLPPYPAHAVTAPHTRADGHGAADRPRRCATARADGARSTTATSHEPAHRTRIATLPAYIDGNVAQQLRAADACDVAVVPRYKPLR
jgi:hypothetical protein